MGLRLRSLMVPESVKVGENVRLACLFDLENKDKEFVFVKWYKDGHEFYRFVPDRQPFNLYFPLDDIKVDVSILQHIALLSRL